VSNQFKVWVLDLSSALLVVMALQLGALQESAYDWKTWAQGVGFAFVSRAIPETLTFIAALRNRWSAEPIIGG